MVKTLSKSGNNKNFTLRLDPDVADRIRARASELRMSQSYYMTGIFELEVKHDLLNQLPDSSEATLDPAEAEAMIERLRSGGFIPSAPADSEIPAPGASVDQGRSAPQRPVMRTREDLLRITRDGTGADVQAALSGNVGSVQAEIRSRQLKEAQEERQERAMRKKILEEQEEDDGAT